MYRSGLYVGLTAKTRIDEVRSSRRKGGNENEFLVYREEVERKRKKERGQINIRDVAQQRFARRSLCFDYFCILRDMKVRLRNFRWIVCLRLVPRLLDTLAILLRAHFPVLRNAM